MSAGRTGANPRSMAGFHGDRLSGLHDLLHRAAGASVLDIAMNHGLIGFEFARKGAALVHGCDRHEPAVNAARGIFSELPIPSRFEVVDLARGAPALEKAFGQDLLPRYDIVLFLGIYHKLKAQTSDAVIGELVRRLASRAAQFFAARTPQADELGTLLAAAGLRRCHVSALSTCADLSPLEIWQPS